jgi:hypothetical protein
MTEIEGFYKSRGRLHSVALQVEDDEVERELADLREDKGIVRILVAGVPVYEKENR